MDYKEKIIEMINKIDRKDILRYIYIIIDDIMKEEKRDYEEKSVNMIFYDKNGR